jgi:FAD dependent oxidoreductase
MTLISSIPSLPAWARPLSERAREASDQAKQGLPPQDKSLHNVPLNPERTTNQLSDMRETFVSYRNLDEVEGFDQSMGEPGKLTFPDGSVAQWNGHSLQGALDYRDSNSVIRYNYNGSQADFQRFEKSGRLELGRVDIATPEKSFSYSTRDPDAPSVEVPRSEYFKSTDCGAKILRGIPADSEEVLFREVFLDGTKSMPQVRNAFQTSLQDGIAKAGLQPKDLASLDKLFQKPSASTPRKLFQALHRLQKTYPDNSKLSSLGEKAGFWQAMEDFPKLQADGITRTSQYYVSPGHLALQTAAQGWDIDQQSGLPIADSIVVGGGPGGLASAYHLSERGTQTVMFEAGFVGQGFSDAGAKSVHQLRTNGAASNLVYTANLNQLGVDVSMQRHLAENREKCADAREEWYKGCGETEHGVSEARGGEVPQSANRAELFEHMSHVAHGLAVKYPDTFVCENSPVTGIEKVSRGDSHLFKVKTAQGHEVLTRSLVMATGFVGSDGQHARSLNQFKTLESDPTAGLTVLENDNALFEDNAKIESDLLVFSERLIGRPEIRNRIESLEAGSRLAVIGGGESAIKGALEALYLNPGVSVDLYTSGKMEPYQTQIPTSVIATPVTEAAIKDKELAKRTIDELDNFGTPVTAASLQELLKFESEGRVRVHEFGKRFSEDTVDLGIDDRKLTVRLKDDEVAQSLREQRGEWTKLGLYGENPPSDDPTNLPAADMVMVAAGYDKRSLRAGPLLQQLVDQDLVELRNGEVAFGDDGLSSAKDPMISFNTAGAVAFASDTAIPGRAVRGYRLAQAMDARLPERNVPEKRIESGLPYGNVDTNQTVENEPWSPERLEAFVSAGGYNPDEIAQRYEEVAKIEDPAERASAKLRVDAAKTFPGPNPTLRALMIRANEVPESLTPTERVMWKRAQELAERISS